ncbi:MAG TPA: alkyl hydroperoxide reductase [Thermoanaerobaculia bacterium]|nr:alkyl hydroperoxide reductase [Thermoanaerobaculia bacterium]
MNRMCLLLVALIGITHSAAFAAADAPQAAPTFYKDVLPILQESCQTCHRTGGANLGGMVAPMSFTTYDETRAWAKSIAKQVEARAMPPWHAAPELNGVFANERTLTDQQVATVVAWATSGAPAGDLADAPPAREWPATADGWMIGEPDLVLSMGEKYFVDDDVEDKYVTFVTEITPEMLPEPRWIKALEFRPGGPVVHHIIARPLGGIAPGNDPTVYEDGFGTLLTPGTQVSWQMHYHKEPGPGTGAWDQSFAAIKFYPEGYTPEFAVLNEGMGKFDFVIPPGDPNYTATTTAKWDRDSILLGYTPHMHLRGSYAKYVARYPDGTQEVLLEVPKYDFNWQTHYAYPAEGKRIPAGTEIELTMAWDNSPGNPNNPDPTDEVRFGEPTTAEMMFGFVSYADAEPGYKAPDEKRGILSTDRIKTIVKERFGLDWDTLTPEQREEIMERLRQARAQRRQSVGD